MANGPVIGAKTPILTGSAGGVVGAGVVGAGVVGAGVVGAGVVSSAGQPIAIRLMANNSANGIKNRFFFTSFSSFLEYF
jgi:hypothetical protein